MLGDLEEDTHLCIKCSVTIVGLENYVRHRKSNCSKRVSATNSLNRDIIDATHSYRSFEFSAEPPSGKHDKQFFNYEIESVAQHHHHDDSHDGVVSAGNILQSPLHSEKVSDYKTDPNKSLTESYDYNYGLGADVFFSSLNLQSSSKMTKPQSATQNVNAEGASTSGTENLMKAVNAISGTKKVSYDSPQYSYEFKYTHDQDHGSPLPHTTEYDDEEDDEIVDEDDDAPPHTHTGGKWKPSERNHSTMHSSVRWYERWDTDDNNQLHLSGSNEELAEHADEYQPPPSWHTKGKWVPGTKIIKLDYKHKERHDSESFSEQFWCQSCNRKLSSRIVYERHLKSKLHTKRSQPENELEEASLPLPRIEEIVSNQTKAATSNKRKRRKKSDSLAENSLNVKAKRKRRFNYIKCQVCKTRLRVWVYGKHLISHYHYRRMLKSPNESIILDNIHRIVHQSPFQCQPCRFYANTEEMFLRHWDSSEHTSNVAENDRLWCAFCKFVCVGNKEMRTHLKSEDHQEVLMAINRSVPIIIRRRAIIECEKCKMEFSYNIELRKHAEMCSESKALGTASNQYQGKFYCEKCQLYFPSIIAFQRHTAGTHFTKSYFCGPCELSFSELDAAKRHRTSAEHKVKVARTKSKKSLKRKCTVCGEHLDDLLLLKQHLKEIHPDHSYSCYFCGQKFILPQSLSRHIRDKVCKTDEENHDSGSLALTEPVDHQTDGLNTISLLELPIITEISHHDVEVAEIIKMEPSTSTVTEHSYNVDKNVKNEVPLHIDDGNQKSIDAPTLWGCKQCDFRTPTEAECIFHEMLHKWNICKNNKIPCPLCNRTFGKNSLRCHLRLHTNERIFKCDEPGCDLKFTRKSNLKQHIERIHLNKRSTVTATAASATPKVKRVAKQSLPSPRSNEQLFSCSICQKRFRKKTSRDQHMHCHREIVAVKVYECPEPNCLFSGRSAAELKTHQNIHSDEKNYHCTTDGCDYKTKTQALLNRHIKAQHQTDSIYLLLCPHCEFTTKMSSHLKRHIRIHTGEKPYKCPHCDYVSNNPENLRKHVINTNKHPGRFLYECKLCQDSGAEQPFATNNTKDYKSHLVIVHNEKK